MKKAGLTLITFMFFIAGVTAQTLVGKWKNKDDKTGKEKAIIEIFKKADGKYYGKIVELLIKPENDKCVKCSGDRKNKALIGLEIVRAMEKDGEEYTDGNILDPKTGKEYNCTITFNGNDKLNVRGYIGISLLGRNQEWTRVK